jgi:DNA-binding GntR family transcriptional regulator
MEAIQNVPPAVVPYAPTVTEVADYLRARTKDKLGNELGTFTDETRPTAVAVESMIGKAASDVAAMLDYDIPKEMYTMTRDLIALGTALRIEISYFPEEVATDHTAWDELYQLYNAQLERIMTALAREQAEEATGDESAGAGVLFAFPTAEPLWTKKM